MIPTLNNYSPEPFRLDAARCRLNIIAMHARMPLYISGKYSAIDPMGY
jgi:hypothetical protein